MVKRRQWYKSQAIFLEYNFFLTMFIQVTGRMFNGFPEWSVNVDQRHIKSKKGKRRGHQCRLYYFIIKQCNWLSTNLGNNY